MVKEDKKARSTGDKKKKEQTQILQRSEIQFEVGNKKTVFFGDTDSKEKVKENGVKRCPSIETKMRVERYQNRPQEMNATAKQRDEEEEEGEEGEERGVVGDNRTEIKEVPRSKVTTAGQKKTRSLNYIFRDKNICKRIEHVIFKTTFRNQKWRYSEQTARKESFSHRGRRG